MMKYKLRTVVNATETEKKECFLVGMKFFTNEEEAKHYAKKVNLNVVSSLRGVLKA